jgi:dihydrolipoamide dehydrogenase
MAEQMQTEVVVLGSGPGGYTAAFRAADLGKKVILVERFPSIGGVCLNVGCIPSKALLHVAKVIDEADTLGEHGVSFGKPKIDAKKVVAWKDKVVQKLTGGLKALAKQRKVEIVTGTGTFADANHLVVKTEQGEVTIKFEQAIIAAGSEAVKLPFIPEDPRIFTSTGALRLPKTDGNMLVIGGGIIGLEMATVYHSLGAKITIVEFMNQLIPGADADIVKPLHKRVEKQYQSIMLETKVTKVEAKKDGLYVTFEGKNAPDKPQKFDQILVAVGRTPNGSRIDADKAGVNVDERGFILVDNQMRTNVANIFAIGDIVGQPMLAHKAIPQGKLAAEVIAGQKHYFDPIGIASVAYTDPEIAWVGLTETQAKEQGIAYEKAAFPWAASGRALSLGREEGVTKLLFDPKSQRVLGAGIVGTQAGDLISEVVLAMEMGCDAEDIALTIHPHPTLSETVAQAAEAFEGTITDLYLPKKKKKG